MAAGNGSGGGSHPVAGAAGFLAAISGCPCRSGDAAAGKCCAVAIDTAGDGSIPVCESRTTGSAPAVAAVQCGTVKCASADAAGKSFEGTAIDGETDVNGVTWHRFGRSKAGMTGIAGHEAAHGMGCVAAGTPRCSAGFCVCRPCVAYQTGGSNRRIAVAGSTRSRERTVGAIVEMAGGANLWIAA